MPLGIEIASDIMRCVGNGEYEAFKWEGYGIIGVIPRRNEPFVWDNPNALRSSTPGPYITMTQAWVKFHGDYRAKCEWQDADGYKFERPASDFIAEAIGLNIPKARTANTVLAVDNNLPEFHQETLLRSMGNAGFVNVELLWRPVCIALYHLEEVGRDRYDEGDQLLIIDMDSYLSELTVLKLKQHRGELVPLRSLPSVENPLDKRFSAFRLKRKFIKQISDGDTNLEDQLASGPFAREFFAFLDNNNEKECEFWYRRDLEYSRFILDPEWRESIKKVKINQMTIEGFRDSLLNRSEFEEATSIIWNGYPSRLLSPKSLTPREIIVNTYAVAIGANEYASRREMNAPTYLDTLPELEIMSAIEGTGRRDFFQLIEEGEIEGGSVKRTQKPRTEFKLEENTTEFTAVLRINKDQCKKLVTNLDIPPYPGTIPLLVKAEQRPANGHAIVKIEGDKEHQGVFGRRRKISLDWKSMEDFEYSHYSGPEVYPVEGRIHKDKEAKTAILQIIHQSGNMSSYVPYTGQNVKFYKLFEPWGYNSPLGISLREPTRGLFGAHYVDDDEIKDIAKRIVPIINKQVLGNRHKHLNQLFVYTPESFLDELRDIFSSDNPPIQSWNTAFAPGRTFSKAVDLELFMDFIIRFSKPLGYPEYPDSSYIPKYFWSYFRALCYYEDTVNVPENKAEQILRILFNYVRRRKQEGWRPWQGEGGRRERNNIENTKKFCLCAILFSLRLRKQYKSFLKVNSELNDLMVQAIREEIGSVRFPTTMLQEVQDDTLSEYVYRFLTEEASEEDFDILKGLTTSMA